MKALLFGENSGHIYDSLGFIDLLRKLGIEVSDCISVVIGRDKDVSGVSKHYILGEINSHKAFIGLKKLYNEYTPDLVVGAATKNITEIFTRLATIKDVPMITEVIEVVSVEEGLILKRNIFGGRATASYKISFPAILTVPQKKFKPESLEGSPEIIEYIVKEEPPIKTIEIKPKEKGAVDIEAAEIVIGVGRGFKDKNDLELAFNLAKLLGGEVGCTRPIAADMGWLGEDRWIGISGKKIRGKLYFAIGISGAPQHIMAASDSKIIVAINKDKNAPIFQYADYGIVADLYQFLPVFINKLKEKSE